MMGRITGLEPETFGTTNQRSNQLSYIRHTVCARCAYILLFGGADRTRTDEMRVACHQVSQPVHMIYTLVELIGLEPTTPCMPCKCSTN